MPANNNDSEKSQDNGADNGVRPGWQDFSKNDDSEGEHQQGDQPSGTIALEGTAPDLPETHFELSETERELITHSPGRSATNHSSRLAQKDKITIAEQFCDRLEITANQTREVKHLIAALNLDRFGNQKRIQKVALVLIRYVVERDRMKRRGEEFQRLSDQSEFQTILDEEGMDLGDVMKLSPLVKDAVQELQRGDDG